MPQLIRTPEEIFRDEGKDIYLIRFRQGDKDIEAIDDIDSRTLCAETRPAIKEIRDWLQTNVPNARMERLAPSEESGWIVGYFGDIRVDFSAAELATFCERWEEPDGKSKDPRFQCFLMPCKPWFEQYGNFVPTLDRPTRLGPTVWWNTPIGFIHHQVEIDQASDEPLLAHPGRPADIWMHAIRLWPELVSIKTSTLTRGSISKSSDGNWEVVYSDCPWSEFSRQDDLRDWFGLPAGTNIIRDEW